jgi:hypothetical protein
MHIHSGPRSPTLRASRAAFWWRRFIVARSVFDGRPIVTGSPWKPRGNWFSDRKGAPQNPFWHCAPDDLTGAADTGPEGYIALVWQR